MADQDVAQLTESTVPALADVLYAMNDPAGSKNDRKITPGNLLKIINLLSSITPDLANDKIPIYDNSGGVVGTTTFSTLLNASAALQNLVTDTTPQLGGDLDAQSNDITQVGRIDFAAATELTIAAGVITVTQTCHTVDTESDTSSDDLATINGGTGEGVLIIRPANDARTVVVKHGTGNIKCIGNGDITLDDAHDFALLIYDGSNWLAAPMAATGAGINNVVEDTTPQAGGDFDMQGNDLQALGLLDFAAATELTIATGAIAVTQTVHTVDTESDAATDDLATITGGTDECVVILRPANDARTVVVKHGTGNIKCVGNADITLDDAHDIVICVYDGTNWNAGGFGGGGGGGGLSNVVEDTSPQLGGDLDCQGNDITGFGLLQSAAVNELTISSGAITVTQTYHKLDTESDAATDDLVTINGGHQDAVLLFRLENGARSVVFKHLSGNISCATNADTTLSRSDELVVAFWNGTHWGVAKLNGGSGLSNVVEDTTPQAGGDFDMQGNDLQTVGLLDFAASTEATIATGAITVSQTVHTVDTESDAATDDLATINGGTDECIVILRPASDARTVVVKHGTGNIKCVGNADITLDDAHDIVVCVYDGTNWNAGGFGGGGGGGGSHVSMTASTTDGTQTTMTSGLSVPSNSVLTGKIWISAVRTDATGEADGWHSDDFAIHNDNGTTAPLTMINSNQIGSSTWSVSIEADDTNDELVIKVTGEASKDITWNADVYYTKAP